MNELVQIEEKIKTFIVETSYTSPDQLDNNTLIFEQGIMDSMGFISIIEFIEDTFSITTADNELIESNFESIQAISDYIFRKLQAK